MSDVGCGMWDVGCGMWEVGGERWEVGGEMVENQFFECCNAEVESPVHHS